MDGFVGDPHIKYEIDGCSINVHDGLLNVQEIDKIYGAICLSAYSFQHSSTIETAKYREWSSELETSDFSRTKLGKISQHLARLYQGEEVSCVGAFISASTHGDNAFIHEDSSSSQERVSVLYYANPVWENDWAGETIFFSGDDARFATSCRPGRILSFSGKVRHRAGVPSRYCPEVRLVISSRFKPARRKDGR